MGTSIRPLYEPVIDLTTGKATAHEVRTEASLDGAVQAIRAAADVPTPLHIPLPAVAISREDRAAEVLLAAASDTGRPAHSVIVQLAETEAIGDLVTVRRRCAWLRTHGLGVAIGGTGDQHASLRLIAEVRPQVVKTGPVLASALAAGSADAAAIIESLAVCCARIGAELVADALGDPAELTAIRALGIGRGQGPALAAAGPEWRAEISMTGAWAAASGSAPNPAGPVMRDLMRPAVTASADASGDTVRDLFSVDERLLTVVLVDDDGRAAGAVHRSRFMIAASGPFGHALNARRSALQHASSPLLVDPAAPVRDTLRAVTSRGGNRIYDDLVVAGHDGSCLGVVHVYDLLTAAHGALVESALSLNALTELPGADSVAQSLREWLAGPAGVAVHWIEARGYQNALDESGFTAANALVRGLGRDLRAITAIVAGSWLGHLGGGEFLLLTERSHAELAVRGVLSRSSNTVAIATVDCPASVVNGPDEASRQIAPAKAAAREATGSSWAVRVAGEADVRLHAGQPPGAAMS